MRPYARLLLGVEAFRAGRAVGRHVRDHGFEVPSELRARVAEPSSWAFAAGVLTLGVAILGRKEAFLVFLAGLALGWGLFDRILEALRRAPPLRGPVVDTTARVT